jgi:hypothetical protein
MAVRALDRLAAPIPRIVDTLKASGFTGIGTGPGQLAPPPPPEDGGSFGLKVDANTPGYSDVAFAYTPPPQKISDIKAALTVFSTLLGFGTSVLTGPKFVATALSQTDPIERDITLTALQGGRNMAFQDGDSGFFGDIWGGINQTLQGGLGQNLLNIGQQALSGFVTQQFAPQPVSMNMGGAQPVMASVPAIARAGGAIATVGRGFFNRFPNLATSIQALRNRGSNVSRSSLYSAMRRFGPEMLVSGGLLTAAAVSELAVAGPGRRRMNPGNVKALRRAHRRMKSFHKVCVDNDQLYKRSRKR